MNSHANKSKSIDDIATEASLAAANFNVKSGTLKNTYQKDISDMIKAALSNALFELKRYSDEREKELTNRIEKLEKEIESIMSDVFYLQKQVCV